MKVRVQPSVSALTAEAAEIDALVSTAIADYDADWYWNLPPGTLCYINAKAGEVWLAQGSPQRRWLADMLADADAATRV